MDTNEELKSRYEKEFKELVPKLHELNQYFKKMDFEANNKDKVFATNPLLLKVDERWDKADIKIMIFGQETNQWGGRAINEDEFGTPVFDENLADINKLMRIYEKFYLKNNGNSSPFWRGYWEIANEIIKSKKNVSFLWNNINKIGRNGKGFVHEIYKVTKENFDILNEEIRILKPNYIIFFTGPNYDKIIEDALGKYETEQIENFTLRQMSIIHFKNDYGIQKAIRTYHPNYLCRDSERIQKYFNEIITELSI